MASESPPIGSKTESGTSASAEKPSSEGEADAPAETPEVPPEKSGAEHAAPKGNVTFGEGSGYLQEWVARASVNTLARRIASALPLTKPAQRVLVVNSMQLSARGLAYQTLTKEMELQELMLTAFLRELKAVASPPPAGKEGTSREGDDRRITVAKSLTGTIAASTVAPATSLLGSVAQVTSVVRSFADLVALFRSDFDVSSQTVAISHTALAGAVAHSLASEGGPAVFLDELSRSPSDSALLAKLWTTMQLRNDVQGEALRLKADIAFAQEQLAHKKEALVAAREAGSETQTETETETKAEPGIAPKNRRALASRKEGAPDPRAQAEADYAAALTTWGTTVLPANVLLEHTVAQLAAFDSLVATIRTPAAEGQQPALLTAILEEQMQAVKHTHILYLSVDSAGGDKATRSALFGRSGRVSYMGGLSATWLLAQAGTGQIVSSGTDAESTNLNYSLASNRGVLTPISTAIGARAAWWRTVQNVLGPLGPIWWIIIGLLVLAVGVPVLTFALGFIVNLIGQVVSALAPLLEAAT